MRIGIVSDLHCNVAGLSQALDRIGDVDELICLGDSIWEYRFSNEIVRLLKERGVHTILGNHEEGVCECDIHVVEFVVSSNQKNIYRILR